MRNKPFVCIKFIVHCVTDAELKVKVQVIDSVEELERVFKDLKKLESAGGKVPLDSNMVDKDKSKDISTEGKDGNVAPEEDVTEDLSSHDKTTLTFEKYAGLFRIFGIFNNQL